MDPISKCFLGVALESYRFQGPSNPVKIHFSKQNGAARQLFKTLLLSLRSSSYDFDPKEKQRAPLVFGKLSYVKNKEPS